MIFRIYAMVKKEFRQIMRDARTLYLIFIFPVFLLILFGYALSLDVKNVTIAIKNNDNSEESRNFVEMLQSSSYFKVVGYIHTQAEVNRYLDEKIAQCVVVFPPNFAADMQSGKNVQLQFLVDGVDGNTATVIINYVTSATRFYNNKITQEFLARNGMKGLVPIDPKPLFWYNPDLNTTKFMIPGSLCMILINNAVILNFRAMFKEKEMSL